MAAQAVPLGYVLDHTPRELWNSLGGARLFITGGTGFFGKWLLAALAHARREYGLDIQATVLRRSAAAGAPLEGGFDTAIGDVRDFAPPPGAFTHVIHAATPASAALNNSRPAEMYDIITTGMRRVLEFSEQAGVSKLLLCSSGAVYGRQPLDLDRVPETYTGGPDPLDPASAYAEGKRAAELLCALSGVPFCSARCFAFLGPGLPLDTHFAAGNFLGDALARRNIVIGGDGTPLRSYMHPADLAIWLYTLLGKGANARSYNVGSEHAVSIRELAERIRGIVAPEIGIEVRGTPDVTRKPERYVPSTARAREELGLETWISLDDAIRHTAAFHGWHSTTPHA